MNFFCMLVIWNLVSSSDDASCNMNLDKMYSTLLLQLKIAKLPSLNNILNLMFMFVQR